MMVYYLVSPFSFNNNHFISSLHLNHYYYSYLMQLPISFSNSLAPSTLSSSNPSFPKANSKFTKLLLPPTKPNTPSKSSQRLPLELPNSKKSNFLSSFTTLTSLKVFLLFLTTKTSIFISLKSPDLATSLAL